MVNGLPGAIERFEVLILFLIFQGLVIMTVISAMGQMFLFFINWNGYFYLHYGSYMKKDVDMEKAISQVEIMDTLIAFLAGLMIIPAVFAFSGKIV